VSNSVLNERIKILIADSSPVYRKMFLGAVEEFDKNASVSCVDNGKDAADIIVRKNPDIVILDTELKGAGLIELIKLVMRDTPRTFILVTSRPSSTSAKVFMEALSIGASDSMTKPIYDSYNENYDTIKTKVSDIIEVLRGHGNAIQHSDKKTLTNRDSLSVDNLDKMIDLDDESGVDGRGKKSKAAVGTKAKKITSSKSFRPQLILIAVSTGGPRALETIIPAIRPDIPVPILIVQHMPPHFIETLVGRLSSKSKLKVKVAEDGEKISGGTVYLAPGGVHMRLNHDNEVYLDDSPPIHGVRPAADALFESVAEDFAGTRVLTVILTGMGHDSLNGLIRLKDKKKCYSIAQSEKTCVVYGMPRAVVEEGLVDKILDLDKIAAEIEGFNYI